MCENPLPPHLIISRFPSSRCYCQVVPHNDCSACELNAIALSRRKKTESSAVMARHSPPCRRHRDCINYKLF